jgi:hypothetical protein
MPLFVHQLSVCKRGLLAIDTSKIDLFREVKKQKLHLEVAS